MEQDWDNLIILDACRYDLFKECNTLGGNLRRFRSRGTHTGEFMRQNFMGGNFPDIVYVSANPNPASVDAHFAAVKEVWESGWDDELHTVPPDTMVEQSLSAEEEHPNKRLICHFIQPHYPWIGPRGREFMARHGYTPQFEEDHIWLQLQDGKLESGKVWELYKENLSVTLPYIEQLVENLDGKTVVTSDHGNAFGEFGVFGHPARMYIPPLVDVPWLEVPSQDRKHIEQNSNTQQFNQEVPKDRLRDLGYIS